MAADMSMWSSEAWSSAADMYLLARSREGSAEAFGELWRRHLPAAYAVAGRYRGRTAAEDIVAEASARVFALIQDGKGPDEHFRAYLLSAVRTVAVDHGRRELKVVPTEDEALEELGEPVLDDLDGAFGSGFEGGFDADLIRTAFRGLSERDQRVLWHTTVEGEAPRILAPVLGMSANAVSARAMRAREALRAQYLDACAARSIPAADSEECRWVIAHLGAHVRGRLPKRQNARVEEHLKTCDHAGAVAVDLRAIHAEFPALIVPFVFLAGLCTTGFVNATAFAGLASAAGAGGATAGAAAAGSADASAAAGAAGASGAATVSSGPPSSGLGDSVAQLASRATTLVAGVAIGVGLVSATPVSVEPAVAAPTPVVTPAAPSPTATPIPAQSPTTTPTQTPTLAPTPRPAPVRTTPPSPVRTSAPTRMPRPPRSKPAPPPAKRVSTAEASVHVVQQRESTRFLLRVRGVEGPVTIVVSTPAGGELTLRNSSWACSPLGAATIRCAGQDGQAMLLQSGLDGPAPIRVVVTDSAGATRTQTLSLG